MLVSIITVTYNSARTIADTLESIKKQSYKNIEHIIIDGKSTDDTLEVVRSFEHVAKVISEKDTGIYDAMNKGVKLASGDVIGILNSDDILNDNLVIEEIAHLFEVNKSIDCIYGNISYFNTSDPSVVTRFWKSSTYFPRYFESGDVPPHPALFVRAITYDEIGLYNTKFKLAADHEFMFRMLKIKNKNSLYIDRLIVRMREGGVSNQGLRSYIESTKELVAVWNINGYSYPFQLYFLRPLKKITQLLSKNS